MQNSCPSTSCALIAALSSTLVACVQSDVDTPRGDASRPRDATTWTDAAVEPDVTSLDTGAAPVDDSGATPVDVAVVVTDGAAPSMFPGYLRDGRTYDQEREYIAWSGPVEFATILHRDGTSLPPSEGGASCSGGCMENVTRINDGGRIRGRFIGVQTFSVQVASTGEGGAGVAVVEACGALVARIPTAGGSTAGFSNQPQPAFNVPTAGECEWSVRAEGGFVYFRAVTIAYRSGPAPTVDLRVNGTDGPLTLDAPARYLLSWTSAHASSCVASGAWMGPRDPAGAVMLTGVGAGNYVYTITCVSGGGMASDSVSVTVNRPPQ